MSDGKTRHYMSEREWHIFEEGVNWERARIRKEIMSRVTDLKVCGKDDNCHELGTLIEGYIPEWLEKENR